MIGLTVMQILCLPTGDACIFLDYRTKYGASCILLEHMYKVSTCVWYVETVLYALFQRC